MNGLKQEIEKLWWPNGHLNENQRDFLINVLEKQKPRFCIETGFASGRSAVTTLLSAKPERLISIDISLDYIGARSHAEFLISKFNNLEIIEGDSSKILTDNFFSEKFSFGIDYAFIDGSHTYEGALTDISTIFPRLNQGGIMIIDDFESGPPDGFSIPDVNRAVVDYSIKNNLEIDRWHMNGKGFAILRKR